MADPVLGTEYTVMGEADNNQRNLSLQDGRAGLPEWMIGDGFWGKWHLSITAEEKREKHFQQERDMCKSQGAVPEILREQGGEHNGQWGW